MTYSLNPKWNGHYEDCRTILYIAREHLVFCTTKNPPLPARMNSEILNSWRLFDLFLFIFGHAKMTELTYRLWKIWLELTHTIHWLPATTGTSLLQIVRRWHCNYRHHLMTYHWFDLSAREWIIQAQIKTSRAIDCMVDYASSVKSNFQNTWKLRRAGSFPSKFSRAIGKSSSSHLDTTLLRHFSENLAILQKEMSHCELLVPCKSTVTLIVQTGLD